MSVISDALRRVRLEDEQRLRPVTDRSGDVLRDDDAIRLTTEIKTPATRAPHPERVNAGRRWMVLREATAVVLALTALGALALVGSVMSGRSSESAASAHEMQPASRPESPAPENTMGTANHTETAMRESAQGIIGQSPAARSETNVGMAMPDSGVSDKYRISAVLRGGETNCAVINGTVVRCGDAVDGAMVRAIDGRGVELELDGQRFRLPVSSPGIPTPPAP